MASRGPTTAENNYCGVSHISEAEWNFHSTDIIYSAAVPGYRVFVVEDYNDPERFPFAELWKEEPAFIV